jgi:AcrR family transcriptional regulator
MSPASASHAPVWWPTDVRGRLTAMMAAVVGERGYGATRVSDVLDRTGISRRTFYAHFANRQDCFFAAYDAIVADVLQLLAPVPDPSGTTVEAIFERLLAHFASWPAHARVVLTEGASAGPAGAARHEQTLAVLAERLARCPDWRPGACASLERADLAQAVLGAMLRMLQLRLSTEGGGSLPSLRPSLVTLTTRVTVAR